MRKAVTNIYLGHHLFKKEIIYYDYDEKHMKKSWKSDEPEYTGPYDEKKILKDAIKQWKKLHGDEIKLEMINAIIEDKLVMTVDANQLLDIIKPDENKEVIHL